MRIIKQERGYFRGTHKTCMVEIERNREVEDRHFYIRVSAKDGGYLYDGWAPADVTTMASAKKEALYGACLQPRPTS